MGQRAHLQRPENLEVAGNDCSDDGPVKAVLSQGDQNQRAGWREQGVDEKLSRQGLRPSGGPAGAARQAGRR